MSAALADMVAAERIKLTSTRAPLLCAVVVAVLGLGTAALQGVAAGAYSHVSPSEAALGLGAFGVPVLMVVAALTVTGEYRTSMIGATLAAMPNRTALLAVKAVVAAAFAVPLTAVVALLSVLIASWTADPGAAAELSLRSAPAWRPVWALPLYAALAVLLAVGVAALLRHSAGAVAVLLMWPFVVEPLLGVLPGTAGRIGGLLPFRNALDFADVPWLFPSTAPWWGPVGSLLYFAAVAAVCFAVGALSLARRDA